jgi:hypothetical protein
MSVHTVAEQHGKPDQPNAGGKATCGEVFAKPQRSAHTHPRARAHTRTHTQVCLGARLALAALRVHVGLWASRARLGALPCRPPTLRRRPRWSAGSPLARPHSAPAPSQTTAASRNGLAGPAPAGERQTQTDRQTDRQTSGLPSYLTCSTCTRHCLCPPQCRAPPPGLHSHSSADRHSTPHALWFPLGSWAAYGNATPPAMAKLML